MKCGRNLLQTIFEYYQNTGVITVEIPTEIFKKPQKSRSRKLKRRRSRYYRNTWIPRSEAPIHFQNLNMNYDSETSFEEPGSTFRNVSSRQTFDKRYVHRYPHVGTHRESENTTSNVPQPKTFVVYPPSISIIDFNVISRNDMEKFCALNKTKQWKSFIILNEPVNAGNRCSNTEIIAKK